MTVSEAIDQILHDAEDGTAAPPTRDSSEEYQRAFAKVLRHKLIKLVNQSSYGLTPEGEKVIELGGFDNWEKAKQQEIQPHTTIHVSGGNAVIGNNNSSVSQGQGGTLINTGNKVRIDSQLEVNKGNFEYLSRELKENHVPDENIRELQSILDTDNPNQEKGIFGTNTNTWISKMISKSLDGSWSVSIGAAGEILADAIKGYYGWH